MPLRQNIVLTGFMGTGKSEVGKRLATRLERTFIDTDMVIERELGTSITQLFTEKGETYFRAHERRIIAQTCQQQDCVIATGGGAMVDLANAELLKKSGLVVCLTATPEVIYNRVRGNTNRPLLQGDEPLIKIRTLIAERAQAYARADVMVETSQRSLDDVVHAVLAAYKKSSADSFE
jgi:shikimate kinase